MAPGPSDVKALLASTESVLRLALIRTSSVLDSFASGSTHSGLIGAGLVQRGIAGGRRLFRIGRERRGDQLRRDGGNRDGEEAEQRRFFVYQAVQLAVWRAPEMAAARKFADILRDFGELERHGVGGADVSVHVEDENRMLGRDRIQLLHRQIAALQEVVVGAGANPLARRRLRGRRLQRGERVGARSSISGNRY